MLPTSGETRNRRMLADAPVAGLCAAYGTVRLAYGGFGPRRFEPGAVLFIEYPAEHTRSPM